MYQSYYDVDSLDYDVMVLLSVATCQLVVSIHYIAQSAPRDKLRIAGASVSELRDMPIIDYDASALVSTLTSVVPK